MKKDTRVKITKISAVEDAAYPTPQMENYIVGSDNGNVSLPAEYTIEGILLNDIAINSSVNVYREIRNNIVSDGYFCTSAVKSFDIDLANEKGTFKTNNSVYYIEKISLE